MTLYWLRVIGPVTGTILYTEYYYSLLYCQQAVAEWNANGMNVETWSNYRVY